MNKNILSAIFLMALFSLSCKLSENNYSAADPWIKHDGPVYKGFYSDFGGFAADACVLKSGNEYLMYYTELIVNDPDIDSDNRVGIALASSQDGISWSSVNTRGADLPGFVALPVEGSWEENLETCFVYQRGAETALLYGAYLQEGAEIYSGSGLKQTMGSSLGLALSEDGIAFSPFQPPPANIVIERTVDSYDEDAVFSPHVLFYEGTYYMIYTGHWWNDPAGGEPSGAFILGATSEDGLSWTKNNEPILLPGNWRDPFDPASGYSWMTGIVAEASFFHGPDGNFYLFFQGEGSDEKMRIGLARAEHPFGPYEIKSEPILEPSEGTFDEEGVIAPHALYDDGLVRLYYNGLFYRKDPDTGEIQTDFHGTPVEQWLLGYAEKRWPVWQQ